VSDPTNQPRDEDTEGRDEDTEGRADLDKAAEEGTIHPPVGTGSAGGFGDETGDTYEEREEAEGGKA
jgi:hypothetical protein